MNPCIEFCHIRHGKEYSKECDDYCDYAKAVKNYKGVIDRVLEIIGSKKVDVGYIDTVGLDEYMHRLGWNDALAIVKVAVLALKGGEQDAS